MQMIRIKFVKDESRTEGFYQLIQRVRVVCLSDDEFMIPESGLKILDDRTIPYVVLEQTGLDHALKALRDSAATPV